MTTRVPPVPQARKPHKTPTPPEVYKPMASVIIDPKACLMFSVRPRASRSRESRLVAHSSHDYDDMHAPHQRSRSSGTPPRDDPEDGIGSFVMMSGPSSMGSFSTLSAATTAFDPSPSNSTLPSYTPHDTPPSSSRRRASEVPRKFFSVTTSNPLRKAMKLSGILAEIPPSPIDEHLEDVTPCSLLDFSRREVPAAPKHQQRHSAQELQRGNSTLTKLMQSDPNSVPQVNPFAEYASVGNPGIDKQYPPMKVRVFFPYSETPHDSMSLMVRRNATVRDLIGFSLWTYCQAEWTPSIMSGKGKTPQDLRATLDSMPEWRLFRIKKDGDVDYEQDPDWSDKLQYLGVNREYALMKLPSPSSASTSSGPPSPLTETKPKRRRATLASFTPPDLVLDSPNHKRSRSSISAMKAPLKSTVREMKSLKILFPEQSGPAGVIVEASHHGCLQHVLDSVCRERAIEYPEDFMFLVVNNATPARPISLNERIANIGSRDELILTRRTILRPSHPSLKLTT